LTIFTWTYTWNCSCRGNRDQHSDHLWINGWGRCAASD